MTKIKKMQIVPWNFEAPQALRDAIINHYVPEMQPGSDERYKNECRYVTTPSKETVSNNRSELVSLLESHGIKVAKISSAGDFHDQGGGNYWALTLELLEDDYYNTSIFISDLGKFVTRDVTWFQQDDSFSYIDDELSDAAKTRIATCEEIISQSDFMWIDEELLSKTIPNLYIYFFGRTEELRICNLLFYWVD